MSELSLSEEFYNWLKVVKVSPGSSADPQSPEDTTINTVADQSKGKDATPPRSCEL